ncbi:MAG: hypothetical protein IKN63_05505 [Bacilli bacterium]|nr:hypothetical protein [Bacilli bacterium]
MEFKNLKKFAVDNDDTLFRSSPLISSYVERIWPEYGSKYLQIKERTISIMQSFFSMVEDEISNAKLENREANLEEFMEILQLNRAEETYTSEIEKTFCRMVNIIKYMFEIVNKEVRRCKILGIKPEIENFNVNRNDVLRGIQEGGNDFYYDNYIRPLQEILECLSDVTNEKEKYLGHDNDELKTQYTREVIINYNSKNELTDCIKPILECRNLAMYLKEMFLEHRDLTLETDGKLPASKGKIPYDKIYDEINWFPYVRENVSELYKTFDSRLISLTAHNGIDGMHGREFEAKGNAIHSINSNIMHYGQRFHPYEHIPGQRRPRTDKGETLEAITGYENLRGVVCLEDSLVVLKQIEAHGGTPIFINYDRRPNPDGYAEIHSTKPENIYRILCELGFDSDNPDDIKQKPVGKKLIKSH